MDCIPLLIWHVAPWRRRDAEGSRPAVAVAASDGTLPASGGTPSAAIAALTAPGGMLTAPGGTLTGSGAELTTSDRTLAPSGGTLTRLTSGFASNQMAPQARGHCRGERSRSGSLAITIPLRAPSAVLTPVGPPSRLQGKIETF